MTQLNYTAIDITILVTNLPHTLHIENLFTNRPIIMTI